MCRDGIWVFLAGINGLMAVLASGYGYHGLAADPGAARMFEIGATFQLAHALALLAIPMITARTDRWIARLAVLAGAAFAVGIVLFSWSVYAYVLIGAMPVPGAAPVGGFAMMLGWVALAAAGGVMIVRGRSRSPNA